MPEVYVRVYVRETNKMQNFLYNLFHINYPWHYQSFFFIHQLTHKWIVLKGKGHPATGRGGPRGSG